MTEDVLLGLAVSVALHVAVPVLVPLMEPLEVPVPVGSGVPLEVVEKELEIVSV